MIILEGMDGSGKSTLATKMGLPVIHPGAPPKTSDLEYQFFSQQQENASKPLVYDRVTCISQQVYRKRLFEWWYMKPLEELLATPHCVIVYCRPPDDVVLNLDNHTVSAHDTPEMLQLVRDNARLFLDSYDQLMSTLPHIKYDFTTTKLEDLYSQVFPSQFSQEEWEKCMNLLKAMRTNS